MIGAYLVNEKARIIFISVDVREGGNYDGQTFLIESRQEK